MSNQITSASVEEPNCSCVPINACISRKCGLRTLLVHSFNNHCYKLDLTHINRVGLSTPTKLEACSRPHNPSKLVLTKLGMFTYEAKDHYKFGGFHSNR